MDGVLVDFEAGIVEQLNKDIHGIEETHRDAGKLRTALEKLGRDHIIIDDVRGKSEASKVVRDYMYGRVGNNSEFWSDLPWMPGGKNYGISSHHTSHIF